MSNALVVNQNHQTLPTSTDLLSLIFTANLHILNIREGYRPATLPIVEHSPADHNGPDARECLFHNLSVTIGAAAGEAMAIVGSSVVLGKLLGFSMCHTSRVFGCDLFDGRRVSQGRRRAENLFEQRTGKLGFAHLLAAQPIDFASMDMEFIELRGK